jgi:redox-sensing transcriptional repressor
VNDQKGTDREKSKARPSATSRAGTAELRDLESAVAAVDEEASVVTGPNGPVDFAVPRFRPEKPVSLQTVERLSVYRKVLEELDRDGVEYVHSHTLAQLVGVTAAQLRRDLASFGTFGNISRGYNVYEMGRTLARILGTDTVQTLALFGVGDLGRALLSYRGFEERGFHIGLTFDVDSSKVGRVFAGRRCYSPDDLEKLLPEHEVRTAVLACRSQGLQLLVDRIARAGVTAFLNFVPKRVATPPGTYIEDIDLSAKLEKLSYLGRQQPPG